MADTNARVERIPALDGLRAVAVVMVIAFHCGLAGMRGGYVGVDVFFVISGFVITRRMLDEDREISLSGFWARRVVRLLPAALIAVLATCVVFSFVATPVERSDVRGDAVAAVLYVANWQQIHESTQYFREAVEASPFLHMWSLSVEEQFYFVWPLVVALVVTPIGRRGRRARTLVVAGLAGVATAWFAIAARVLPADRVYFGTDTRVYQILAGAALATAVAGAGRAPGWHRARALGISTGVAAGVGLVVAVATSGIPQNLRGALAAAATVCAIASVESAPEGMFARMLGRRGLVAVGRVSYGMYLWHWPLVVVLLRIFVIGPRALLAAVLVGSFVLGFVSYQLVERPAIEAARGRHAVAMRGVVTAGIGATALLGLVAVPMALSGRIPVLAAAQRPGFAGAPGPGAANTVPLTTQVPPDPPSISSPAAPTTVVPTSTVPSSTSPGSTPAATTVPLVPPPGAPVPPDLGMVPPLPVPGAGVCINQPIGPRDTCQVTTGSGERVLLFGDSHAADLLAMVAKLAVERQLELHVVAVVGCPWQMTLQQVGYDDEDCAGVQAAIGAFVERIDPDVIVVAKHPTLEPGYEVRLRDGPETPLDLAGVEGATRDALGVLGGAHGRRIVIVEPRPTAPFDVPSCLSAARTVDECAFTPLDDFVAEADMLRAVTAEDPNVSTLDLRDLVCPRLPICDPILSGRLVWKDFDHLTDGFVQTIQAAFAERAGLS